MKSAIYVVLWLMITVTLSSCRRTVDLGNDEFYKIAIGKQFVLQRNFNVYSPKDRILTPFIANLEDTNLQATKMGMIKKGQILQIIRIVNKKSFENNFIAYSVKLTNPNVDQYRFGEMEISFLTNTHDIIPFKKEWNDPPIFKQEAALPSINDGIWWKGGAPPILTK